MARAPVLMVTAGISLIALAAMATLEREPARATVDPSMFISDQEARPFTIEPMSIEPLAIVTAVGVITINWREVQRRAAKYDGDYTWPIEEYDLWALILLCARDGRCGK